MHARHAHPRAGTRSARGRVRVVQPLHQHRAPRRRRVTRQEVVEHCADRESARKLRGEHRVDQLLTDHTADVLAHVHHVGVGGKARDTPREHHLAEPEPLRELLARLAEPPRKPRPARVGPAPKVDPKEHVAARVMVVEEATSRDLFEGAFVLILLGREHQRARARDELAVDLDDDLPLGKDRHVVGELRCRPRHGGG